MKAPWIIRAMRACGSGRRPFAKALVLSGARTVLGVAGLLVAGALTAASAQDNDTAPGEPARSEPASLQIAAGSLGRGARARLVPDLGLRMPVPPGLCSIADVEAYRTYVQSVSTQMERASNKVFDIAVPCDAVDMIERPIEEQTGFPQWLIYAGYLSPDGSVVIDMGMEAEAFFDELADELDLQEDIADQIADARGQTMSLSEPVRTDHAIFWPLILEMNQGPEAVPVRGVASVSLVDSTPVAAYWYANQVLSPRSFDDILADQEDLVADLRRLNGAYSSPAPSFFTRERLMILGLGGVIVLIALFAAARARLRRS